MVFSSVKFICTQIYYLGSKGIIIINLSKYGLKASLRGLKAEQVLVKLAV